IQKARTALPPQEASSPNPIYRNKLFLEDGWDIRFLRSLILEFYTFPDPIVFGCYSFVTDSKIPIRSEGTFACRGLDSEVCKLGLYNMKNPNRQRILSTGRLCTRSIFRTSKLELLSPLVAYRNCR
ncbi:hypothetical protein BES34_014445, partial [Leptospira inadai serovar Lyme]